jgi:hypothetical protein
MRVTECSQRLETVGTLIIECYLFEGVKLLRLLTIRAPRSHASSLKLRTKREHSRRLTCGEQRGCLELAFAPVRRLKSIGSFNFRFRTVPCEVIG